MITKMENKRTIKDIYELSPEELQELDLKEWNELLLFEWDPDYMVTAWAGDDYMTPQNHVYFFLWNDKNMIIASNTDDDDSNKKLLDFVNDTGKWESLKKQTWEWFNECKNTKIAFRNWVGYVYRLYERID